VTLYPYSVIPGGAEDVAELRSAVARDPVVAEHYAGFDLGHARLVRLDDDRQAYVSYRLGDHVFWTSRKLTLHKGETVFTDGNHTARTRCGNLVAEIQEALLNPPELESSPPGEIGIYIFPPISITSGEGFGPSGFPGIPTPEPDGIVLISSGAAVLVALRKRRKA
jgi:hypothetical protein